MCGHRRWQPRTAPTPATLTRTTCVPSVPRTLCRGLTDLNGWDEEAHYRNILTGDLDGDGIDELVARGQRGTQVYRWLSDVGQWRQVSIVPILSDADGWDRTGRYQTIQLGDVDGDAKAELVARGTNGMVVYRYTSGPTPDRASWTQLAGAGPFTDAQGWGGDPSYFTTIKLVPVGRQGSAPTMQLIGRGTDGLHLFRWNGTGWTELATLTDLSNAAGWNQPAYYSTIMAWDETTLLARSREGIRVYEYDASSPGPGSWAGCDAGLFPDRDGWTRPEYYSTIQMLRIPLFDGPKIIARGVGGLNAFVIDQDSCVSQQLFPGLEPIPLTDADGWDQAEYYSTIQSADIDGDEWDEVIVRGATGISAYSLEFEPLPAHWSAAISPWIPALVDDPWGTDPSYYATIGTVGLDAGSPARALLARGPHGLRTWDFDTVESMWSRPRPYGSFPDLDVTALEAMADFLGLAAGSIRSAYTDPARDPNRGPAAGIPGGHRRHLHGARGG